MEPDLIEAFIKLVEYKSFTKAADVLCISQSALSHRLNRLEKELKLTLIVRNRGKREFNLTQAGMDFIPIADRWMTLTKDVHNFKRDQNVHFLTIASIETISFMFSKLYKKLTFSPTSPFSLLFDTHTFPSFQIIDYIENHDIDVGFTVRQRVSRNLKIEPLFRERHYLIGDLGSDRQMLDPRKLDPRKELITDWSTDYLSWHDFYFGTDNQPLAIVDTATMAVNFLVEGTWCIVPKSSIAFLKTNSALNGTHVQVYEIPDPPPDRTCYKITHRSPRVNRNQMICYFESALNEFLADNDLRL